MDKKSKKPVAIGMPEISPEKGVQLLKKQVQTGEELLASLPIDEDKYSTWVLLTKNYLEKSFGNNSPNVTTVSSVGRYGSYPMNAGKDWWANHRRESLQTQLSKLGGLIELLTTEIELQDNSIIANEGKVYGHKIFLVHGQNEQSVHEAARFIEKLEQSVVILREQPNQGRTIIEKFEEYADVGYAVVLLTADDKGGNASCSHDQLQSRARQNVIFELGYFIGRLGRNRVCALYHAGVEIPSDYAGVLYVELDEKGAWRLQLAREFRAAGLNVDMNNAL